MSSLWDCHLYYSKIEAKLMFLGPKRVPSPLNSVKSHMAQNLLVPVYTPLLDCQDLRRFVLASKLANQHPRSLPLTGIGQTNEGTAW